MVQSGNKLHFLGDAKHKPFKVQLGGDLAMVGMSTLVLNTTSMQWPGRSPDGQDQLADLQVSLRDKFSEGGRGKGKEQAHMDSQAPSLCVLHGRCSLWRGFNYGVCCEAVQGSQGSGPSIQLNSQLPW